MFQEPHETTRNPAESASNAVRSAPPPAGDQPYIEIQIDRTREPPTFAAVVWQPMPALGTVTDDDAADRAPARACIIARPAMLSLDAALTDLQQLVDTLQVALAIAPRTSTKLLRTCRVCGKSFTARRHDAALCSGRCRKRASLGKGGSVKQPPKRHTSVRTKTGKDKRHA